jgi:hypothetical protein
MSGKNDTPNGGNGFGKPPKDTRFRKGVSGNPSGRPRGKLNWATVRDQILQEKVAININGVSKLLTTGEALLRQLTIMGMSRDLAAIRLVFNLWPMQENSPSDVPNTRINNSDQLLKGMGNTVSDSVVYEVPNAVRAGRTLSIIKLIYGVNIPGTYPIMIMSEKELKELVLRVRKIYGFPVTKGEVLKLANDGLLIEAAEAEAGRRPEEQ